jgi:hypothetical protein
VKKLLTTVSIALVFIMAAAVSGFCTDLGTEASSPISELNASFANPPLHANPPLQLLAQARSDSGDEVSNPQSNTNTLVSDGLLRPGGEDSQASADGKFDNDKVEKSEKDDPPAPGRCKNGNHVGNKHCVPSPSE